MSTVGQAVGGIVGGVVGFFASGFNPMGAVYGAQIGMMAGGYLDPPKGPTMKGPRLSDLSVQTSTYGSPLPRIYGQYGTFGNIIWLENNKLKEVVRKTEQGGKGGASTTTVKTYEYYATFAVSLSDTKPTGPMAGVKRIWIGGELFYNAGSDDRSTIAASNSASNLFRFYSGSETQLPDPRMQADIGEECPAFRGVCYIVFYDLPLEKYGNSLLGTQVKVEIVDDIEQELSVTEISITNPIGWSAVTGDNTPLAMVGIQSGGSVGANFLNKFSWQISNTSATGVSRAYYDKYRRYFVAGVVSPSGSFSLFSADTGVYVGSVPVEPQDLSDIGIKAGLGLIVFSRTSPSFRMAVYLYGIGVKEFSYVVPLTSADGLDSDDFANAVKYPQSFYIDDALVIATNTRVFLLSAGSYQIFYTYDGSDPTFKFTGVVSDGTSAYVSYSDATGEMIARIDQDEMTDLFSIPDNTELCDYDSESGALITTRSVYSKTGEIEFSFYELTREQLPARAISMGGFVFFPESNEAVSPQGMIIAAPYYSSGDADLRSIIENECLQSNMLELSDIDASELVQPVRGYRVSDTGAIRAAIEPLQGAWPFDVVQRGYKIHFVPRGNASVLTIPAEDLDARQDADAPGTQLMISNEMDTQLPRRVQIRYTDTVREYDIAEQAQERMATESINIRDIEMPIVLNANEAAGMAEVLLYLYWMERRDVGFILPPNYRALEPADVVTITGEWGIYELRLTNISLMSDGRLECKAKYNSAAIYTPTAEGEEGSAIPDGTVPFDGPSIYALLDIPLLVDENNTPGMPIGMAGYSPSWPGGIIYRTSDGGQNWTLLQAFAAPATMGFATDTIGAGRVDIFDAKNRLSVSMLAGSLSSIDILTQLNGGNLFAYGAPGRWEMCSARNCELQPNGSYLLTDWLRGRFGTEWAMTTHQSGDYLVLMSDPDVLFVSYPSASIGVEMGYRGVTAGDSIDSTSTRNETYNAVNLTPLSPVYLNGNQHPVSEDWSLSWIRRGRLSPEWRNNVDVPVGEVSESYEVDIFSDNSYTTLKRTLTTSTPDVVYTAAQQIEDFTETVNVIYVRVYQMSAIVGRGYPLTGELESAAAWTPANLPVLPGFWINETSPVTLVSSAVSQINDISGNSRNLTQGISANRPTLGDFDGFRTLSFDGTNDKMSMSNQGALFRNAPSAWVFSLYRTGITDVSITERPILTASTNASSARVFMGAAGGGSSAANRPIFGGRRLDAEGSGTLYTHTAPESEAWVMVLGINTYTAQTIDMYVNGEISGGLTGVFSGAGNSSNTDSSSIKIGTNLTELTHYNGQIAELMAGNTAVSGDDIDRIFGYCAWKYGLVDLLPSDHPYKHQRPSV